MCQWCPRIQWLVIRVLEGSADSFQENELCAYAHARSLEGISANHSGWFPNLGDREDLAVESVQRFYRGLAKYNSDEYPCPVGLINWTAHRVAVEAHRRRQNGDDLTDTDGPNGEGVDMDGLEDLDGRDPDEALSGQSDARELIRKIKNELVGQEPEVWRLWLECSWSDEEISAELPINSGALRNAKSRIRRKVERVERYHLLEPALSEDLSEKELVVLHRVVVRLKSDVSISRDLGVSPCCIQDARAHAWDAVRRHCGGRVPQGWERLQDGN